MKAGYFSPSQERLAREMRELDDEHLTAFHEAARERDRLVIEVATLRALLPQIASAIGNGSVVSAECSLEFAAELPKEVRLVTEALRREVATLKAAHWMQSLTEEQLSEARFYADLEGYRVRVEKVEAALTAERDQLRAEVERLNQSRNKQLRDCVVLKQEAERNQSLWQSEYARAEKAEAALAAEAQDLRSCKICGLTVNVTKGHVAPDPDFTMQGRTKPTEQPKTEGSP